MFDDWDHFKGDFKGKVAQKKELELKPISTIENIFKQMAADMDAALYGMVGINPVSLNSQKNTGINSYSPLPKGLIPIEFGPRMFDDILGVGYALKPIDGRNMPAMSTKEYEQSLCEHDPIDVGFAKVKMACRKCDKDL